MQSKYDTIIVGGGHGGAQAAIALRQKGYEGTLAIVSEEGELPYDRPALSKEYFAGDKTFDRLQLRPASFWAERKIEFLTRQCVVAIDPSAHTVSTAGGATIEYRHLIWATGGAPKRLACAGHDYEGVHSVRTRADVDHIRSELETVTDVAIVGGGYIGLEAAAVLRKLGKSVTILEAQERVLARVAGPAISHFYESEHRSRGVDIRLNARIECLTGEGKRVSGVRLVDGETISAQLVIVGIGVTPVVVPLLAAGAAGGDGIDVDAQCRTTLQDVFAVGDCARHSNTFAGSVFLRVESIQNANDMANTVASVITAGNGEYCSVPWFWSNQYDLKLQTVGISSGYDEQVVRGEPTKRSFSVVYLRGGQVVALDCVNNPKEYVQGRALVVNKVRPSIEALRDSEIPLSTHSAAVA